MNVIARLEFELAYYDSAVHRFSHYTTRTPFKFRFYLLREYMSYQGQIVQSALLFIKGCMSFPRALFVSASHQTGLDTRSMTRRSIIVGIRGLDGRVWAVARALLNYAGHRPSLCNMGLMSLTGHGPKSGSRYISLIIA